MIQTVCVYCPWLYVLRKIMPVGTLLAFCKFEYFFSYIINMTPATFKQLVNTHDVNICKHRRLGKKIHKTQKRLYSLIEEYDTLGRLNLQNCAKIFKYNKEVKQKTLDERKSKHKEQYGRRCENWLKKRNVDTRFFNKNQLIEKCHEMYHHDMLQGYTFALNNECTCGLWTYGLATCLCGNTPIFYNHKKINYGYDGDISLDDIAPVYAICATD